MLACQLREPAASPPARQVVDRHPRAPLIPPNGRTMELGRKAEPVPRPKAGPATTAPQPPERSAASPAMSVDGMAAGDEFWLLCAMQWQTCQCRGTMRWGVEGKWKEYVNPEPNAVQRIACSIEKLPDVAPGDDAKRCYCR